MLVQFALCDIKDSTDAPLFPRSRFIFHNGTAAVWHENDDHTLTRLARVTGTTFGRRKTALEPNILTLDDATWWRIYPITSGGGCGCGSKVSSYSIEELLSPDLVTI